MEFALLQELASAIENIGFLTIEKVSGFEKEEETEWTISLTNGDDIYFYHIYHSQDFRNLYENKCFIQVNDGIEHSLHDELENVELDKMNEIIRSHYKKIN